MACGCELSYDGFQSRISYDSKQKGTTIPSFGLVQVQDRNVRGSRNYDVARGNNLQPVFTMKRNTPRVQNNSISDGNVVTYLPDIGMIPGYFDSNLRYIGQSWPMTHKAVNEVYAYTSNESNLNLKRPKTTQDQDSDHIRSKETDGVEIKS